MGNFYRCPRIWAASGRSHAVPAFGDTLFGVQSYNDAPDMPEPTKDGGSANWDLWGDFGCAWHCLVCLEQLHRDPLTLASASLRIVVADTMQPVPRIADTAVYVTTARVLCAVCDVVAAKGGVVPGTSTSSSSSSSSARSLHEAGLTSPCTGAAWKSSETPSVAPLYSDVVRLLEDAWRKAADPRRCRPFLRLWSGRLLQLKFVVELCFGEAFAPAPHPAKLSALAIRVLAALEVHDAASLWAAMQLLGDPERRASVVGPSRDRTESGAACVMLQLQGYTALLLNPLRPLKACGCSVDEALRRMTTATDALVATSPGEVCWLGTWQLVHCADHTFRHACHRDAVDGNSNGMTSSDVAALQNWAVRSVESAAIWRCGDPYAAIVAIFAVRTLILWRGLLLQQQEPSSPPGVRRSLRQTHGRSELLKSLERALEGVWAHCVAATGAGGDAAAEARAVSMLLNDHHLASAPQLAAQQPCLLHAKRNSIKDYERSVGRSSCLNAGYENTNVGSGPKQHVLSTLGNATNCPPCASEPTGFEGEDRREAVRTAMGFSDRVSSPRLAPQTAGASTGNGTEAAASTALPADGAAFCALLDGPTPRCSREASPTPGGSRATTPTAPMPPAEEAAASKPMDGSAGGADPEAPSVEAVEGAVLFNAEVSSQEQFLDSGVGSVRTSGVLLSAQAALASEELGAQARFLDQAAKASQDQILEAHPDSKRTYGSLLSAEVELASQAVGGLAGLPHHAARAATRGTSSLLLSAEAVLASEEVGARVERPVQAARVEEHHQLIMPLTSPESEMQPHGLTAASVLSKAPAASSDAASTEMTCGSTPPSDAAAMPADDDIFDRMCSEIVERNESPILRSALLSE